MSTTTEILFNSPALHSLKRDQLVKLCKIHSLKANGKNAELIDRLKQRAAQLPPDDDTRMPRASEQWEMVMDDIQEVDEPASEHTNIYSTAVTLSLKAIASSFGIRRGKNTTASLPVFPTADTLPHSLPTEPIPGNPARPGIPAPPHARLSTSAPTSGLTTTIRLISSSYGSPAPSPPRLAPYQTTFDIDMADIHSTPPSLYPRVPFEDLLSTPVTQFNPPSHHNTSQTPLPAFRPTPQTDDGAPQDIFSPIPTRSAKKRQTPGAGRISAAADAPFLFGSPLPQHNLSNKAFGHAAAEVLQEMNRRLDEAGVPQLRPLHDAGSLGKRPTTGGDASTNTDNRFAKAHEDAFSKMDSIATHYAARRGAPQPLGKKRKSEALGAKRKSSSNAAATTAHSGQGVRVISTGVRKHMGIPGGFDDDDGSSVTEEDAGARRSSKRIRVAETGTDVHTGRRVSLVPAERERREKEKEAVKKRLEASKARRRSGSRGRLSVAPPLAKPKSAASRFGFFSSAKTLVKNVWNMGAGTSSHNNNNAAGSSSKPTSSIPVAKPSTVYPTTNNNGGGGAGAQSGHIRVPSGSSLLKPTSSSAAKAATTTTVESTVSSRTRSPIPSFNGATSTSRLPTRPPSTSSMGGTQKGAVGVSSMGTRRGMNIGGGGGDSVRKRSTSGSSVSSSTLMAPTASSIARSTKRQSAMTVLPVVAEQQQQQTRRAGGRLGPSSSSSPVTLMQITNRKASSPSSPRPTKIFSKPLTSFASPTTTTTMLNEHASLSAAASTLLSCKVPSTAIHVPGTAETTTVAVSPPPSAAALAPKPRSLIARKPRISRSRVIAKLGAQRAASATAAPAAAVGRPSGGLAAPAGRTRSSMGAGPRRSLGVKAGGRNGGEVVMMMGVRKRARQSEYYARRRSGKGGGGSMDVDS
ncbi:hypothetical protein PHLCEN_2v9017 [Hermanssonia centrifuga]|uniref:SAP domain-containing protein n=1 Tax=Hermanssonia centrifuga TaxID=98765 RepID=A0A2R6NSC8_9APHY|nr:hypothetical protein PHLCEN_2v9017 [Hermanssonia centrifuga]